ncbi:TFIIB-type zinc ribbon-containing protein [Candidatus Bathyarchaeota archaeon]|nr:TFIIB-type zinc ribbon-containing protein [Candidatus Bathyarchaeota archaeon]
MKYLKSEGMITARREGHKIMYEIVKSEPPFYGWEIPWEVLMMTKKDWEKLWREVDFKIKEYELEKMKRDILKKKYEKILNFISMPEIKNILEVFEKAGIDWRIKLPQLLPTLIRHLKAPICPECLLKYKTHHHSIFDPETGEFICPNCGLVIEIMPYREHRPAREQPSPFPPPP